MEVIIVAFVGSLIIQVVVTLWRRGCINEAFLQGHIKGAKSVEEMVLNRAAKHDYDLNKVWEDLLR